MSRTASRTIVEEEDVEISDFSTDELTKELEARGYKVSDGPEYPPSTACSIKSMDDLRKRFAKNPPEPTF